MEVNIEPGNAIANDPTNTITYTWTVGPDVVTGTNFAVQLYNFDCWSGDGSPISTPSGFTINTSGDHVTSITYTDVGLFAKTKDATGGKYEFCVVARSYLSGPLYINFAETKTTLTVTNLHQIEGAFAFAQFNIDSDISEKAEATVSPEVALQDAAIQGNICGDSVMPGPVTFISICITQDALNYGVHLTDIEDLTFTMGGVTQAAYTSSNAQTLTTAYVCTEANGIETCRFDTLLKADFFHLGGILTAQGGITLGDTARRQLRSMVEAEIDFDEEYRTFYFEIVLPGPGSAGAGGRSESGAPGLILGSTLSGLTMAMGAALYFLV